MSAGRSEKASKVARVLPPLALLAVLIGTWELASRTGALADVLGLEPFFVPSPSEIATALWVDRSLLAENAWVTFGEVVGGFGIALVLGVAMAAVLHLSPPVRRSVYPLAVASQAIPIAVVAPILVVWFGFGAGPKVAIVALICFFPIVVNAVDGLGAAGADQRKLMRSLGAGPARTFAWLEAPTALPRLLSGMKIAIAIAVIGAVFGESAGATAGLGRLIAIDNNQLEVARMFASVVILAAMAIALFALLALVERRLVWWGSQQR